MADLVVALRLTADGKQLRAEVQGSARSLDELARKAKGAGSEGAAGLRDAVRSLEEVRGGADAGGAAFARLASVARVAQGALAAAGVAITLGSIVKAGDEATSSLSRLSSATGNLATAGDVYDRLYQLSLRTGAAVGDSVAAFTRFSVAARDIGATNDQVLRLISGIQGFGRLAGTSTAEMASATLQLGQALASGTLQGDELRSVLEAMPQLAQALAGQLGMSVGELRKAGAEGRLTAEQVFPALLRASDQVQQQLSGLPVTLSQGTGILTTAMDRFLAQIDAAIGASGRLARGLAAAGNALDATRQGLGLRTPGEQVDFNRTELARLERERAALAEAQARLSQPGRRGSLRQAQSPEQLLEQARALDEEIARLRIEVDNDERDRTSRRLSEQAEADRQAAEGRRNRAQAEYDALRVETDRELRLRQEFARRIATLRRAAAEGVIDPETARADTARLQAELEAEIRKLSGGTAVAGGRATRSAEADPFRGFRDAARRLEIETRTPLEAYSARVRELDALVALGGLGQVAYNRALDQATRDFEKAGRAADDAGDGVGRLDQALDGLQEELRGVGKETADYLAKAVIGVDGVRFSFDQLAAKLASGVLSRLIYDEITGPLSRALVQMARMGLGSLGGLFGFDSSIAPTTSAQTSGLVIPALHTGGVAGVDFPALRRVPADLFRTAPKFHSGTPFLMPDEQPAVLRKGEIVLTPAQAAAVGGGGGTMVQIIDQRGANAPPAEVSETTGGDGRRTIGILIRAEMRGAIADGSLDRDMRNSFGISRRGA